MSLTLFDKCQKLFVLRSITVLEIKVHTHNLLLSIIWTVIKFIPVICKAADNIICSDTKNSTFRKDWPCKWTNGYSFEEALLLSIFLGMFGADRFYLGYPGLGLLKLCTMGFMFIGQLIDIILIATQVVGPADGSHYVTPYFGAGINIIRSDNNTYRVPQSDW